MRVSLQYHGIYKSTNLTQSKIYNKYELRRWPDWSVLKYINIYCIKRIKENHA